MWGPYSGACDTKKVGMFSELVKTYGWFNMCVLGFTLHKPVSKLIKNK